MTHVAVIGAGWAGLAAAVAGVQAGRQITVFEAARTLGGRARSLPVHLPDGSTTILDNGQHILAGAYAQTLRLMREVGVDPAQVLLRIPLTLRFPDGLGVAFPDWPAPFDAAFGIVSAKGWNWRDKVSLLRAAHDWRRAGFQCAQDATVAQLCTSVTSRVMAEMIEPLCVAALNTPVERSSGQVFLRVIRDALFAQGSGAGAGSNLLLPREDLGRIFPQAAADWLMAHGALVRTGQRVTSLARQGDGWLVDGKGFDRVVLACPARDSARLVEASGAGSAEWVRQALALQYEAITTVYAFGDHQLPLPMLALRSTPDAPAQFVFDRGQLGGPRGLLAFVVSASQGDHDVMQQQVLAQARSLGWGNLQPVQTVVEKRATFACTPALQRPAMSIAEHLFACGDYVSGPYPSTLEGAVRSGLEAAAALNPA